MNIDINTLQIDLPYIFGLTSNDIEFDCLVRDGKVTDVKVSDDSMPDFSRDQMMSLKKEVQSWFENQKEGKS